MASPGANAAKAEAELVHSAGLVMWIILIAAALGLLCDLVLDRRSLSETAACVIAVLAAVFLRTKHKRLADAYRRDEEAEK